MRRIALALASAALFGSGCTVSTSSTPGGETVDFSWQFIRTLASGATATPYSCALAGIDTVQVDFPTGSVSLPCSDPAGDGGAVTGLPAGPQPVTVTAFRGAHALYQVDTNVNVVAGQVTPVQVNVYGIPDDLDIYALFRSALGAVVPGWSVCSGPSVATLTYSLEDVAGTVVASGSVPCTDPAGVSFSGAARLERDNYHVRMQGFLTGSTLETFDSASTAFGCSGQPFNHYGADIGASGVGVFLYDVSQNTTFCP